MLRNWLNNRRINKWIDKGVDVKIKNGFFDKPVQEEKSTLKDKLEKIKLKVSEMEELQLDPKWSKWESTLLNDYVRSLLGVVGKKGDYERGLADGAVLKLRQYLMIPRSLKKEERRLQKEHDKAETRRKSREERQAPGIVSV